MTLAVSKGHADSQVNTPERSLLKLDNLLTPLPLLPHRHHHPVCQCTSRKLATGATPPRHPRRKGTHNRAICLHHPASPLRTATRDTPRLAKHLAGR